jgi:hypothetical protein
VFTWRTSEPATGIIVLSGPVSRSANCSALDTTCSVTIGGLKPGTYSYTITADTGYRQETGTGTLIIDPISFRFYITNVQSDRNEGTMNITWDTTPPKAEVVSGTINGIAKKTYYDSGTGGYRTLEHCPITGTVSGIGPGELIISGVCSNADYYLSGTVTIYDGVSNIVRSFSNTNYNRVDPPDIETWAHNSPLFTGYIETLKNKVAFPAIYTGYGSLYKPKQGGDYTTVTYSNQPLLMDTGPTDTIYFTLLTINPLNPPSSGDEVISFDSAAICPGVFKWVQTRYGGDIRYMCTFIYP